MGLKVAVLGGGAAGFFAAFSVKKHHPGAEVAIFEKTSKVLGKVKISGGGRCNVTHNCLEVGKLSKNYPRGGNFLKKAFQSFSVKDTIDWFESRGVLLKSEEDGRMFPITDSSQTIIDCFLKEAQLLGIRLQLKKEVLEVKVEEKGDIVLVFKDGKKEVYDKIIIASGGTPKRRGLKWLEGIGLAIEEPLPSLFTFNMPTEKTQKLMGLSVLKVTAKVEGTKLQQEGALLFTHWGMSGPAILKLSAWGAKELAQRNYQFHLLVNWAAGLNEAQVRDKIEETRLQNGKKKLANQKPLEVPNRLWEWLLEKSAIYPDKLWGELNKKEKNRLVNTLVSDRYEVKGKTTFKEEFVTCGGVSLFNIDAKSMQSKKMPGLYFAGEVLNIDGVTGGFNFQAAWTTGFIAGQLND